MIRPYIHVRSMPSDRLDKIQARTAPRECVVCGFPLPNGTLCNECAVLATRLSKGDKEALPVLIRRYNEGND